MTLPREAPIGCAAHHAVEVHRALPLVRHYLARLGLLPSSDNPAGVVAESAGDLILLRDQWHNALCEPAKLIKILKAAQPGRMRRFWSLVKPARSDGSGVAPVAPETTQEATGGPAPVAASEAAERPVSSGGNTPSPPPGEKVEVGLVAALVALLDRSPKGYVHGTMAELAATLRWDADVPLTGAGMSRLIKSHAAEIAEAGLVFIKARSRKDGLKHTLCRMSDADRVLAAVARRAALTPS